MKSERLGSIAVVIGTRPEAIKMAPVIRALRECSNEFETVIVSTGQHRQMLDQVLSLFTITPDVDLDLMLPNQDLADLTSNVLKVMQNRLMQIGPDLVLVQGDTTTAFATALAAFYLNVPVCHLEAGLRSHDSSNPFPEEINRHIISVLTDIHLAPTPLARRNLVNEGIPAEKIVITGNTVVDSLIRFLEIPFTFDETPLADIKLERHPVILLTSHRRESWGRDLENICLAVKDLVSMFSDLLVVFPVHMNPNVNDKVRGILADVERVHLTPPLDYLVFINLMRSSYLVLTDSGGVQEEAPTLHKPLLVLREATERPEAFQCGLSRVVGTIRKEIVREVSQLLTDHAAYRTMAEGENPFGDGRAAERVIEVLRRWFKGKYPLLEPEKEFRPPVQRRGSY